MGAGSDVHERVPGAGFPGAVAHDGVAVLPAVRSRAREVSGAPHRPGLRASSSGHHTLGAFVVRDGAVRWRPALDVTRIVVTTEVVVAAVLVAWRFADRPTAPNAKVTMGPGGWVSMKSGAVAVRPASRPWGRPRPLPEAGAGRAPLWARTLSAVPLQALLR